MRGKLGITLPAEGKQGLHSHDYTVDLEGNGVTSFNSGHQHKIEKGKVLDSESGHTHGEVYLEDMHWMKSKYLT